MRHMRGYDMRETKDLEQCAISLTPLRFRNPFL